jgi:hypothetical protein
MASEEHPHVVPGRAIGSLAGTGKAGEDVSAPDDDCDFGIHLQHLLKFSCNLS